MINTSDILGLARAYLGIPFGFSVFYTPIGLRRIVFASILFIFVGIVIYMHFYYGNKQKRTKKRSKRRN
jgi:hypothetical protein